MPKQTTDIKTKEIDEAIKRVFGIKRFDVRNIPKVLNRHGFLTFEQVVEKIWR